MLHRSKHLTAQRDGVAALGVDVNRMYVDHGLTGTNQERPGPREALAACREGDTLVVTKLDRLARSLPDTRPFADELTAGQVRLNLGGSVYDPTDLVDRLLFNVLAMVAEFESDLIRRHTKEGAGHALRDGNALWRRSLFGCRSCFLLWVACDEEVLSTNTCGQPLRVSEIGCPGPGEDRAGLPSCSSTRTETYMHRVAHGP